MKPTLIEFIKSDHALNLRHESMRKDLSNSKGFAMIHLQIIWNDLIEHLQCCENCKHVDISYEENYCVKYGKCIMGNEWIESNKNLWEMKI